MPPILTRQYLRPGETGFLFDALGGLDPSSLRLHTAAGDELSVDAPNVARRAVQFWDRGFHCGITVPADAPAGEYQLVRAGEPNGLAVTVIAAPQRPDVNFDNRGTYFIGKPLVLQPNTHYYGYGTTLIRIWDGSYANHIFEPTENVTLEGFTVRWEPWPGVPVSAPRYVFKNGDPTDPPVPNVTLRNCSFHAGACEGAQIGEWDRPGFLAEDCLFEGVGTAPVTGPCLFLRCRWTGPTRDGIDAFTSWGASGIALVDCDFDGTDRGPCLNAVRGPIRDVLLSGLQVTNLRHCVNGCESLGLEGRAGPVERLTALHYRYDGVGTFLEPWDADASDILVRDFTANGIGVLAGQIGGRHERIVLQDGEIHGGTVRFGKNTFDCAVRGVVLLIDPRPTLGSEFGLNQFGVVPWPVPPDGYENANGPAVNDMGGLQIVTAVATGQPS